VPAAPRSNEGEVGVWIVTLPEVHESWSEAWGVISQDERERANRLVRDEDRDLWVHTRAILRRLLGAHLSADPQLIVFGEGPHGKPELSEPVNKERLDFSVSHSSAISVIAVARDRRVGIDVERIQPDLSWGPISKRLFSEADDSFIEGRPHAERTLAFFDCWVRKESYLKGLGVGLKRVLCDFSVPLGSAVGCVEDPEMHPVPCDERRWRIHPIEVPDGYAAALAVEGLCNITSVTTASSSIP
jgi:4'-phosphopantetheinyl transferase